MKKMFYIFVISIISGLTLGCNESLVEIVDKKDVSNGQEGPNRQEEPILTQKEISKIVNNGIRSYLEVEGVPFPLLGAQIRVDALVNGEKNIEGIEKYFVKAKELNVNCVQIPIWWNNIEPAEREYNFDVVDKILSLSNKYDIKIELLWFSTNMIGGAYSYFVPSYILNNAETRLDREGDGDFTSFYGNKYALILDDEWILEKETLAVSALFNHIRFWDSQNGEKHPVITAQIHNEPDGFVKNGLDEYGYKYRDGSPLPKEKAWSMTLNALDSIGKAVKRSSYKVATRVNLMRSNGIDPFPTAPSAKPEDVFLLEGIDFISVDPYYEDIHYLEREVKAYRSINGNYALMAENKGTYKSTPSLILKTASLGGGYDIYDLATSKFFLDNDKNPNVDHGIYTWDLQKRDHTDQTAQIIKGLVAASPDLVAVTDEDFLSFNIVDGIPEQSCTQTLRSSLVEVEFSTSKGAIGFVMDLGTHLLVYATEEAVFDFKNTQFSSIVAGYYDTKGNFIVTDSNVETSNKLETKGSVLYKIMYEAKELSNEKILYDGENVNSSWNPYSAQNNGELSGLSWSEMLSEVSNPDRSGVNKSGKCLQFHRAKNANQWPGIYCSEFLQSIELRNLDKITMMIKKEVAGDVVIEINGTDNSKKLYLQTSYDDKVGEWQLLEFDPKKPVLWSTEEAPEDLGRVNISVHYEDNSKTPLDKNFDVYIDDIRIIYK